MVASRLLSAGLVDGSRCVALGLLKWKWLTVVDICCRPASPWQLPCILAIVKTSMGQPKQKHPAGPETVPIKRTFFKKTVILPQCRANLMIGNPGKTWGAFFRFSASSLQRMRSKQLASSILVNASPLPSSQRSHRSQQRSNM